MPRRKCGTYTNLIGDGYERLASAIGEKIKYGASNGKI